ncbi:transcriptional regulator, MerR family [Aeromicrobium marinum DSM 15272]|uniref:Transcriptional regulator, MerR family n=1 Tax=Aeromicrobium marinum DSM 15272 TaxID=585531 RepID=E2S9R3_9ACTN|nr:MerR family transcriptional regulator [Aeromicrobium marinum]EFQ83987.1 transcriptional regulator, MerR family [Aeromicrobium marinum DSM 15272]
MTEPMPEIARLGIGKVLDEMRVEFPDLTITKIRYLESEGLLEPERTSSGYRKFSFADVERLRFILRQQRDAFWPLSHIREVLDDMDNGRVPSAGRWSPSVALAADDLPDAATFSEKPSQVRLTRADLLEAAGIDGDVLDELEAHGVIERRPNQTYYDGDDLAVANLAGEFAQLGVEPRHLRPFRAAATREVSLIRQVLDPRAGDDAQRVTADLAALSVRLHTLLVRHGLQGR